MTQRRFTHKRPQEGEAGQMQVCFTCSQGQLLGEMNGTLKAIAATQQEHTAKMNSMDGRLRTVEQRSVLAASISALVVSLGLDLLRGKLGMKG